MGNCYFLASLSAIAENPNRIKKLFTQENNELSYNKEFGVYNIKICVQGQWKNVIVDEFFPCITKQRGPAFTRGNDGEIWVLLLEKAWAKVNGSYSEIEKGLTRECLHDFTGAPVLQLWLDDSSNHDYVWHELLRAEKNNYVMTCGSGDGKSLADYQKVGILKGQPYSLLGAYEINVEGKETRILKLRNPWQVVEWRGKYSDNDANFMKLTHQQKQLMGTKENADGSLSYIEGTQKRDREVWTAQPQDQELEAGVYYIYTKIDWNQSEIQDFVISTYGVNNTILTEITKYECPEFLRNIYIDHARNVSKKSKKLMHNKNAWVLLEQTDDGYFYLAIQNSTDQPMQCEFKFSKLEGLKLRKPFTGKISNFTVPSNNFEVVLIKVLDYNDLQGIQIKQSIIFKSKDQN
ncbi:hypothetical protein IMG5_194210 [Ichthyophthirius multifiliis]|uniref:Calpain catalytic domain-containing protein n=1 Tax=Ichthyophthirius multifiliis TaxID=5932 RepID=G0R4Q2_ICHMU|nr:hypothetical protein IMG5_194210 [Ichthyophthirius multifiliis]EGR27558.1 hypothetical protein IMG5_194210 [Ichthyophthirius multifiliis]|eukprot:XP_004025010.1 hypothetical protein IMG5_194210 [Ichthyophthirius multifiliis]